MPFKSKSDRQEYLLSYHLALKLECFNAYGGLRCALCPESRIPALGVDHIDGGGNTHRAVAGRGNAFYHWLKRNGFPPGYRVLCSNCNWKQHLLSQSDKPLSQKPAAKSTRKALQEAKDELLDRLGGKCGHCGVDDPDLLTIHHLNNDGAEHRMRISAGKSGKWFYKAVLESEDLSGLQCRCFSCNDAEWSKG